jgi:hypothetical protein
MDLNIVKKPHECTAKEDVGMKLTGLTVEYSSFLR